MTPATTSKSWTRLVRVAFPVHGSAGLQPQVQPRPDYKDHVGLRLPWVAAGNHVPSLDRVALLADDGDPT
jgi:hypothetical protein